MHATFLSQLSTGDLTAVKLKFQAGKGEVLKLVVGADLSYESPQPSLMPEMASLIHRMRNEKSELLLGCDANSHHRATQDTGCGGTETPPKEILQSTGQD
ncbi:hypothetical protein PV326_011828 [Microctonus aethiopoides]|nr:hypothetical protein PV326_011828 [Microctonus aethiopoides]